MVKANAWERYKPQYEYYGSAASIKRSAAHTIKHRKKHYAQEIKEKLIQALEKISK